MAFIIGVKTADLSTAPTLRGIEKLLIEGSAKKIACKSAAHRQKRRVDALDINPTVLHCLDAIRNLDQLACGDVSRKELGLAGAAFGTVEPEPRRPSRRKWTHGDALRPAVTKRFIDLQQTNPSRIVLFFASERPRQPYS